MSLSCSALTVVSYAEFQRIIICSVEELARKHGKTMAQIALAWVMAKDGKPVLSRPQLALGHLLNLFDQRSLLPSSAPHRLRN